MSHMHQLIVSVLVNEATGFPKGRVSDEYSRFATLRFGQDMQHEGVPVHMVTCAQSPVAIDPRSIGLHDVWSRLTEDEIIKFKMQYPGVYLALMLLMGDTDVPTNPPTRA